MVDRVIIVPRWSERQPVLALLCCLLIAFAALGGLHATGAGSLAPPPVDPAGWTAWAADRDPVVAIIAVARLAVLAVGWYLLASLVLGVLAGLGRSARLVRLTDFVTVRPVRRVVSAALGMLLAAGVAGAQPAAGAPVAATPLPVELVIGGQRGGASTEPRAVQVHGDVLRPVPREGTLVFEGPSHSAPSSADGEAQDDVSRAALPDERVGAAHEPSAGQTSERTSEQTPSEHEVQPGESFWSIADSMLRADGTEVTESQVRVYWLAMIEVNRDRLLVADDPDLLYPGQWVRLPATTSSVGR